MIIPIQNSKSLLSSGQPLSPVAPNISLNSHSCTLNQH